ncbi:MAG: DM13 domain-containing protein [Acidimicrobiia bacterium]
MTPTGKWLLTSGGLVVAVVGFLLFRPDTLFTDVRVEESLEAAFTATTTASGVTPSRGTAPSTAPPGSTTSLVEPTTATTAAGPVGLTSGSFTGIDHRASGSVTIYEQDGQRVLRFEDDTDIQNGPDLYVWLLASESYEGGIPTEYLDLGLLKGNVGGQNYVLPASFDPETHRAVLIWCLRFTVPFAAAPLG